MTPTEQWMFEEYLKLEKELDETEARLKAYDAQFKNVLSRMKNRPVYRTQRFERAKIKPP